ncbi:MAG: hypothetical protein JWR53_15 [Glaciihabitans sp.]|nr:hypothetical protein [Glaciihabitans sp.]
MPESVELWWARRQWSKGVEQPYAIGTYRADWERYRVLVRQYHPDLNHGISLTQVPPAADVYLLWQCDVGHKFVATPEEQRMRPGASRRRSTWCPECAALAQPKPLRPAGWAPPESPVHSPESYACGHPRDPNRIESDPDDDRCYLCRRLDGSAISREQLLAMVTPSARPSLSVETTTVRNYRWVCPAGHGTYEARIENVLAGRRCRVCRNAAAAADAVAVGEAFASPWAPRPASAAEPALRSAIAARLPVDEALNAVKVARPFFFHVEVWPDILLPELRVAIEYDTTGREGLEHVGRNEERDRRKDALLRAVGWEVVRVRCGKLRPIGPYDVMASGVTGTLIDRLIDQLRLARGDLIVNAYLL